MEKLITLYLTLVVTLPLQSANLEVDIPWDYEQIQADAKLLEKSKFKLNQEFDWNEPSHSYYVFINAMDFASTVYALENRDNLVEANPILPMRPSTETLLFQKVFLTGVFAEAGLFGEEQWNQDWLFLLNTAVTIVTLQNLYLINSNE